MATKGITWSLTGIESIAITYYINSTEQKSIEIYDGDYIEVYCKSNAVTFSGISLSNGYTYPVSCNASGSPFTVKSSSSGWTDRYLTVSSNTNSTVEVYAEEEFSGIEATINLIGLDEVRLKYIGVDSLSYTIYFTEDDNPLQIQPNSDITILSYTLSEGYIEPVMAKGSGSSWDISEDNLLEFGSSDKTFSLTATEYSEPEDDGIEATIKLIGLDEVRLKYKGSDGYNYTIYFTEDDNPLIIAPNTDIEILSYTLSDGYLEPVTAQGTGSAWDIADDNKLEFGSSNKTFTLEASEEIIDEGIEADISLIGLDEVKIKYIGSDGYSYTIYFTEDDNPLLIQKNSDIEVLSYVLSDGYTTPVYAYSSGSKWNIDDDNLLEFESVNKSFTLEASNISVVTITFDHYRGLKKYGDSSIVEVAYGTVVDGTASKYRRTDIPGCVYAGASPTSVTATEPQTIIIKYKYKWTNSKVSGEEFNLTAQEWKDLQAFVNDQRSSVYTSFTVPVANETEFTHGIYREMVNAIGKGTLVDRGDAITQELMDELVTNANAMAGL